jgi:predicted dehydrogenase
MNAGHIPSDHWVHGDEGGGRNLGEACHIYDFLTYLTNSQIQSINARAVTPRTDYYRRNDNFSALLTFENGSVATFTYTAMGDPAFPKEQLDVFFDGTVVRLDDFQALTVSGRKTGGLSTRIAQKGLREEFEAFHAAVTRGGSWPIPLWQQIQATEMAIEVEAQLARC